MKEVKLIKSSINRLPKGKPFTAKSMIGKGSPANVRQALSRLSKAGKIIRVTRGIYVRPKEVPFLGKVLPGSEEIIKIIAKQTGETIALHGAEAAHRLNLSTQVPLQSIYYTSGTTRKIKVGNLEIILKHISPNKLVKSETTTGLVISALRYLGKNQVNTKVIATIKACLSSKEFSELVNNTKLMPFWMIEAIEKFNKENKDEGELF